MLFVFRSVHHVFSELFCLLVYASDLNNFKCDFVSVYFNDATGIDAVMYEILFASVVVIFQGLLLFLSPFVFYDIF